jgi:hypothetical protein
MIIYCHVVVVLVWLNMVVKQFIRALNDVYALTFGLIVAPTRFSTKGGGREMINDMHRSTHAAASHDIGRCDAPLPLHCMLVNALWIIDDPMAIL